MRVSKRNVYNFYDNRSDTYGRALAFACVDLKVSRTSTTSREMGRLGFIETFEPRGLPLWFIRRSVPLYILRSPMHIAEYP